MSQLPVLRVGLACLTRSRFDYAAARQLYHASLDALGQFPQVELIAPDDIILDNPDDPTPGLIERAVTFFRQGPIDALIIQSGTFTMGDLALDLVDSFHIPIILWALPEPAESTGRLRLNSLVGLNVNAIHLFKTGRPSTEMFIRGTLSRVKTDPPVNRVMDEIIYHGWEHHLAMSYADLVADLEEFATMTNIPLTVVS